MISARWQADMDARRSISLLVSAAGFALFALGIAASPTPWSLGSVAVVAAGAISGAAIGGYHRHRVSDPERQLLWAVASAAPVAVTMVATLGTAVLIRPVVRDIPGLDDAWSGVLVVSGLLVAFVGALLWERDSRRRRFAALLGLGFLVIVGGVFVRMAGDPWALLGALVALGGFGVLLVALEVVRRSSRQDAATPDTWR